MFFSSVKMEMWTFLMDDMPKIPMAMESFIVTKTFTSCTSKGSGSLQYNFPWKLQISRNNYKTGPIIKFFLYISYAHVLLSSNIQSSQQQHYKLCFSFFHHQGAQSCLEEVHIPEVNLQGAVALGLWCLGVGGGMWEQAPLVHGLGHFGGASCTEEYGPVHQPRSC